MRFRWVEISFTVNAAIAVHVFSWLVHVAGELVTSRLLFYCHKTSASVRICRHIRRATYLLRCDW